MYQQSLWIKLDLVNNCKLFNQQQSNFAKQNSISDRIFIFYICKRPEEHGKGYGLAWQTSSYEKFASIETPIENMTNMQQFQFGFNLLPNATDERMKVLISHPYCLDRCKEPEIGVCKVAIRKTTTRKWNVLNLDHRFWVLVLLFAIMSVILCVKFILWPGCGRICSSSNQMVDIELNQSLARQPNHESQRKKSGTGSNLTN